MKQRLLGRTGILVSEICLGTMTFGGRGFWQQIGQPGPREATQIVRGALDGGVNLFDTAAVYSEGEAERLLGQALKEISTPRADVVIATKVRGRTGPGSDAVGLSRGHIMSAVKASLTRLDTDYIDLYQIHGADLLTPLDETLRALDKASALRPEYPAWMIERQNNDPARPGAARLAGPISHTSGG
jgi:aryl-alcohol dehydrogenase-like predicted oxidoreductase